MNGGIQAFPQSRRSATTRLDPADVRVIGEEALDALGPQDQNPNSVYARFLLRQLRQPGLEITDLAKRVQREVETLARTIGHQ